MKPFGESDSTNAVNERRLEAEFRAQRAEGKRRQREYEGLPAEGLGNKTRHAKLGETLLGTGMNVGPVILPDATGRSHSMDSTPPDIYVTGTADLIGLKKELADLDRDIDLMLKHETVNYFPTEDESKNG